MKTPVFEGRLGRVARLVASSIEADEEESSGVPVLCCFPDNHI